MTGMRSISKLEAKVAGFFTSHERKLDKNGQRFSSEPTEVELAQFLDPDHHNNIKIWDDIEKLSSAAVLIPWWLVMVCSGILFAGAIWAPPEEGAEVWPLSWRLLGCLVISLLLFISAYVLNAIQKAKGIYFIYNKIKRTLELPQYKVTVTSDQIHSLFLLQARNFSGYWTCELSVLIRIEQGGFVRYSIGIDARPKRLRELGKTLAGYIDVSFDTLKLNRKTVNALGLDLKTVFGKCKLLEQKESL
jgi:hypothetical protein